MISIVAIKTILGFSLLCGCDAFRSNGMDAGRTPLPIPVETAATLATAPDRACLRTRLQMGGRTNKQRREDRKRFQNNNEMLDFIDEPRTSYEMVGDSDSIAFAPEDDDLADLVRCVVKAADGRKADNIVAMRVSKVSTVTSFVVIATGNSRPQNQAITAVVKEDVEKAFGLLPGANGVPEGSADSGWTILDYGSIMVHVMTPKSRLFYNVEGKWKDQGGEYMDISDAILPNMVPAEEQSASVGSTMQGLSEEEDPFWS
mmetsp:Transcript_6356/g.15747  ORF Transcript_6356/g.15747 Transcript_6356/m.15747 type:complete len:259 (-) Transcript_6356:99-875(-)